MEVNNIGNIKEELKKDPSATIGKLVMQDIINGNADNQDLLEQMNRESEEKFSQKIKKLEKYELRSILLG